MPIMTRATNASPDASSKPTRKKRVTFHFHIDPRAPPVESRVKLTNARTHFSVATGNLSDDAGEPITEPNSKPGLY